MATKAFYSVSVFCIYVRATEVEAANMTKMVFEGQRDRSGGCGKSKIYGDYVGTSFILSFIDLAFTSEYS